MRIDAGREDAPANNDMERVVYRGVGFTAVLPLDREGQGTRVREGDLAPTAHPSIQLRDSAGLAPASPGPLPRFGSNPHRT